MAYQTLAFQLTALGRLDEAVAWGKRAYELSSDPIVGIPMAFAYIEFGEFAKIMEIFSDVTPEHPMAIYGVVAQRVFRKDFAGALELVENAIEGVENPAQIQYALISSLAMITGDFDKARTFAERLNPEFAADADLDVDVFNARNLVAYAFILQNQGENKRAETLLAAALIVVRTQHRMGIAGHGIRDVQILALQGKSFEALAALREAIDEGFQIGRASCRERV